MLNGNIKKVIKEVISLILLSIIFIILGNFIKKIATSYNPYLYVKADFLVMFFYFILGVFINSINKKKPSKLLKFNGVYFMCFCLCITIILLMWIINNSLPAIILENFKSLNYIVSIYAGAFFASAIFHDNN